MALSIYVVPRATRTEVVGLHGDAIRIRIAAPPVDRAANAELIRFIAERLGVGRGAVTIKTGGSSRRKALEIAGVTPQEARRRLLAP
jgi:uncharacterized protein (TIGR00251 family)